jgi:hypothetical protein
MQLWLRAWHAQFRVLALLGVVIAGNALWSQLRERSVRRRIGELIGPGTPR